MNTISPASYRNNPSVYTLIDVRTPNEFTEAHIENAKLHPVDDLSPERVKADLDGRPALVSCLAGGRAKRAAEKLAAAGIETVLLEGSLQGWERAGFPVVRATPKGIPIFRQVLLTVGIINLIASILALTVNFHWVWVPVFTGCGMIIAGATGFCGMALILAKMPWNRVKTGSCSNSSCCCKH